MIVFVKQLLAYQVRVGVNAPKNVRVDREEIRERINREQQGAGRAADEKMA